jgi:hypothetical protein
MSSLKEKSEQRLNSCRLSHPVTGPASAPGRSLEGSRDSTAFWLAGDFLCGDAEPLPSMFTSKMKASRAEPQPVKAHLAGLAPLAAGLRKWHISNKAASYIIASFLLLFAAADGFLLTASTFSADRSALIGQAAPAADQEGTETATVFSAPAFEAAEGSQAQLLAPGALPESEHWSAAVGVFEQLLAQQKASEAAAIKKQEENERLLKRLEAWVEARAQKPAVFAGACVAPAGQCWKGTALIR